MRALETMAVALERGEATARDDVSLFGLLKQMSSPEARRGLSALVEFVKGLGAPQGAPGPARSLKKTEGE
jgi:uncharacterized protein YjgD (DUF1641 family)